MIMILEVGYAAIIVHVAKGENLCIYVYREVFIDNLPSKHWLPVHPTGHSHVSGATHTPGSGQSAQMAEINVVEYG